ncbi:MAG: glycosyltransferase family 9 protein [Bacteroidales bacterium]
MKKFLVVRFSSIGDIVLTSPVIRLLKKTYPNSQIHTVTKRKFAHLFSLNPNVDKVHSFEGSLIPLLKTLQTENYDYIIDLHSNIRSFLIRLFLWKKSFVLHKINIYKWLIVNIKVNILPKLHIVDRYINTLSSFGIKNDNLGLDFFIPENEKNIPNIDFFLKNTFVALVIGGQYITKKLPVLQLIELCKKINYPIVILGGELEKETARCIATGCPNVIDFSANLNIYQSAILIKLSKTVISHDTGLMHIAAALKKDIISIWGNTIPKFGMTPYLAGKQSKIFEVNNLKCRPCSKIGFQKCPKKHFFCMKKQNIFEIASYTNYLMQKK